MWFRWSNNLLDKSKFIFNKSLNVDTGTINVSTSGNWYAIEEYIDFKQYAGKTVSLSSRLTVAFYDSNKKYISSIVARINPTGIVPTNAVYIRADVYKDYYDVVQLEIGNTPTEYQPYVEPQIFIKNSNGVYEEFIKKSEEVYSTEETKIGTWIDSKPLYRKTIVDTTFRTDFYFIANDIKQFVNQYGYVQRKDYPNSCQFINSRAGTNMSIQFLASSIDSGIQIDWGSNWKENYSTLFNKIIITVEYTKTTD